MDATMENFMHGPSPLVAGCIYKYFKDVSRARPAIEESISGVDFKAVDKPSIMCHLYLKLLKFMVSFVYCPKFDSPVMARDKTIRSLVEKADVETLLLVLIRGRLRAFRATLLHVPADQLVSIFEAPERDQVHIIAGK